MKIKNTVLSNRCTNIQFVDTIRIIIQYLKLLQHVSDHKGYIIRELCTVHVNGQDSTITVILAKHCIEIPDDGSLVIRNMLEQF